VDDFGDIYNGFVTGSKYYLVRSYQKDVGLTSEIAEILVSSSTQCSGDAWFVCDDSDDCYCEWTISISKVVSAPVANFSAETVIGKSPLTVRFSDESTGDIVSRSWNFGDGSSNTAQNPSHIYYSPGT
jgi:PKD repeat protein